jgi:hypothetical protein
VLSDLSHSCESLSLSLIIILHIDCRRSQFFRIPYHSDFPSPILEKKHRTSMDIEMKAACILWLSVIKVVHSWFRFLFFRNLRLGNPWAYFNQETFWGFYSEVLMLLLPYTSGNYCFLSATTLVCNFYRIVNCTMCTPAAPLVASDICCIWSSQAPHHLDPQLSSVVGLLLSKTTQVLQRNLF